MWKLTEGERTEHMSMTIGNHVFDGPYTTTEDLMNDPGVFAVIVAKGNIGSLIDVGESNNVGECVENHRSKVRWNKFASAGTLCFAVLYTPGFDQAERSSIEQDIRAQYEADSQGENTANAEGKDFR